jgi:Fe2+ transport system protein B
MKKIIGFIFCLMAIASSIMAQDPTPQQLAQQIKLLTDMRRADSLRILSLIDSLKQRGQAINGIQKRLDDHELDLQKADAGIKQFGKRLEVTDENRYRVIKSNLVYSVELFEMLNERLNTLDALNQLESYQQILVDLNNPANESMGFSYNKKVIDLISNNIQTKKKSRLMELTQMVLDNPILKGVTSLTPILSVGNSVFSVISSFAAQDDRISSSSLQTVKNELDRYTIYYGKLNEANATFQRNLANYRINVSNLHNKVKDFTVKNLQEGGYSTTVAKQAPNSTVGDYLSGLFQIYNREAVEKYFTNLENTNRDSKGIKYETLLKSNTQLINMNKRTQEVMDIYKEFETIYRQYIAMIEKNNEVMQEILNLAITEKLSDSASKVTEQINRLKTEKQKGISSIERAINIEKLKNTVERLDSFFPAL